MTVGSDGWTRDLDEVRLKLTLVTKQATTPACATAFTRRGVRRVYDDTLHLTIS
jgi:hypothetical protein